MKERGNDPTLRRELAGVYYKVGEIYRDLGQFAGREPVVSPRRGGSTKPLPQNRPDDAELQHGLAMALGRTGHAVQAIPMLEKSIRPEDPQVSCRPG